MNTPATCTQNSNLEPLGPTKFTIIYDDFETGTRAKRFAEMLAAAVGGSGECDIALCRSELLEVAGFANEATREAAVSDFVILALRGDTSLPFATKHWIETWLETANGEAACLVALFDPNRNTARFANSTRTYLRHVASAAGVDFFAHSALPPQAETARDLSAQATLLTTGLAAA